MTLATSVVYRSILVTYCQHICLLLNCYSNGVRGIRVRWVEVEGFEGVGGIERVW
jgi:hypothetical protein